MWVPSLKPATQKASKLTHLEAQVDLIGKEGRPGEKVKGTPKLSIARDREGTETFR